MTLLNKMSALQRSAANEEEEEEEDDDDDEEVRASERVRRTDSVFRPFFSFQLEISSSSSITCSTSH